MLMLLNKTQNPNFATPGLWPEAFDTAVACSDEFLALRRVMGKSPKLELFAQKWGLSIRLTIGSNNQQAQRKPLDSGTHQ